MCNLTLLFFFCFCFCDSYDDRWAKKAYNQKLRRRACADIMRTSVTLSSCGRDEPTEPVELPAPALGSVTEERGDDDQSSPSRPFQLTPKRKKAIEAVRFIAAHLKNEDDYAEVIAHNTFIFFLIHSFILFTYVFIAVS